MANPYFAFKKFTVYHDKCAMKVGTDGVLLGAWADTSGARRILDVGTGSGLISMMLAQRSQAFIDAVEIEDKAYEQARENSAASPWRDRIAVIHQSFQHFSGTTTTRYDLVVSNPPYFRNALKPPADSRSLARHDDRLGYESLMQGSRDILAPEGRLAVIIPANETVRFTQLAYLEELYPCRLTWVRPDPLKKYSRCLMEFTLNRMLNCSTDELIIKEGNNAAFTVEYIALTKEFYLKF